MLAAGGPSLSVARPSRQAGHAGRERQLREEADRCFRSLDCPDTLKTEEEIQRLQAVLGRLVGLSLITLRAVEAVHAVFSEDGSHACGPRLQDLVIKLSKVSPLPLHACLPAWAQARREAASFVCLL